MRPGFLQILAVFACALPLARGAPAPAEIPAYRQGIEALSSHLWEIAAARFQTALETKGLTDSTRNEILLRLAETQVRGDQATAALETLAQLKPANGPAGTFWRAHALAGLGKFRESADLFAPLAADSGSPFHTEAAFTRASLLLSLGDVAAARATLEPLTKGPRASQATLRLAEIAFDQGDPATARKWLAQLKSPAAPLDREAQYLDARLLLQEGKPDAAASSFASLVADPQGQSLVHHHGAALGLAAAFAAAGDPGKATETLVAFIQNYPQSPLLETAFRSLLTLLPAQATPADPILEQMAKWSPAPPAAAAPVPLAAAGCAVAWPTLPAERSDRAAMALWFRALGLRTIQQPVARNETLRLLRRLRLEYPDHFLARRSLLESGRWLLEEGKPAEAAAALAALEDTAVDPRVKAAASFLAAKSSFLASRFDEAAALFTKAAEALDDQAEEAALVDAGIARLLAGRSAPPPGDATPAVRADLQLERALFLATSEDPSARAALADFLQAHPGHPRAAEAHLALARAALASDPQDPTLAEAQLDAIQQLQPLPVPVSELALARLRVHQAQNRWDEVASVAREFLAQHPDDPAAPEVTLHLGTALFRKGDFHQARITLEQLAQTDTDAARAAAALFLAARSAALSATTQARAESLALYQKVIDTRGPLADAATMEKSRTLIDLTRLDEAITLLRPFWSKLDAASPLRLPAGALLGEALYAKGGNDPAAWRECLTLCETLAKASPPHSSWNHRFQYLRGLTLEQLDEPGKAVDIYYSVLESAKVQPPEDWEWLERAGFRALALIESAERWNSATALAATIASFKGPRAEEAAARARKLRLEHMIWDDQ